MKAKRAGKDIAAVIRDRTAINEAFVLAFGDAVRRHRAGGVPMAVWQDGKVALIDPFSIPLPDEPGSEQPS